MSDNLEQLIRKTLQQNFTVLEIMSKFKDLAITVNDGLRIIMLNRPKKYNAVTIDMYVDIAAALKEAAEDVNTKVTVLTGAGNYYCSGNDLSNFQSMSSGDDIEALTKQASINLQKFIQSFIDFPKLLVAVVNGPAIGIAVTSLALCDVAYASNTATFNTPFVQLGQTPEACSSYTFPKIMGQSLANEVLLLGRKLNAQEALGCGLVSRVSSNLENDIWPMLRKIAKDISLPPMIHGKTLIRGWDKEALTKANATECRRLEERWGSEDCMAAIVQFFMRKSKM